MASAGSNREHYGRPPEFYVSPTTAPEVAAALRSIWPWLWHHVGVELGDPARAVDINDRVADQVSAFVRRYPDKVRSIAGLCRTTAINVVKSVQARERRIDYKGLSQDLEGYARPAEGSVEQLEFWIWLEQILDNADPEVKTMLSLRILGKTWGRIGKALGMSAGQARLRFRREIERVCGEQGEQK